MKTRGLFGDFVIRNANVITVDNEDTKAEAIAVRDGIIIKVGANCDMEPLIGGQVRSLEEYWNIWGSGWLKEDLNPGPMPHRANPLRLLRFSDPDL
ncbi:MAG: hypothetical protein ACFFCW_06745 [Candidatus Hodarchaeota archaeon]